MEQADMDEADHRSKTEKYRRSWRLAEDMERAQAAYFKAAPVDQDRREDNDDPAMRARFEDWMKQQGRAYRDEEEKARRFAIFRSVARFVDAANADAMEAGHNTRFGLNKFSDWNAKEVRGLGRGLSMSDEEHLCMVKPYLVKQGIWHKVVADRKAAGEVIPDCSSMKQILQNCMRELQYNSYKSRNLKMEKGGGELKTNQNEPL